MHFGKKALAFLAVMLMIFSNGFTTLPALAADEPDKPVQESAPIREIPANEQDRSGKPSPTGELTLKKCFDDGIGDPDQEFSFTVTGPGKDGAVRTVKVTAGDRGGTTVKLPYGTYYIRETVPTGYKFISFTAQPSSGTAMETADTLRVVVGEASVAGAEGVPTCYGPNFTVTCKNRRIARLDLGKAVAGAAAGDGTKFTLEITKQGFSQTVTLANGQRQTLELEPGTYTIEEKTVDPDYRFVGFTGGKPVSGRNAVEVTVGKICWSVAVTCNNQKLGKLAINKTDSVTKGPVAGVVFEISGPDFSGQKTTGSDGTIEISRLKPGDNYTVREISAPAGYNIRNADAVTKEIPVGGTAVFNFVDDPHGRVRITKVDADNPERKLDGAVFEIADNKDFANAVALPATVDGITTSPELLAGHWWIRETKAPDGYALDSTVKEVDVKLNETAEVEFRNMKDEGAIRVLKLDRQTQKPVAGVTFQLLGRDPADPAFSPSDILGTRVTGDGGVALFAGLKPGTTYWVRETAGPDGYRIDATDVRKVTVAPGTIELVFENDGLGRIRITKIDKLTKCKLDGAVFEIADNKDFKGAVTLPATKDGVTTSDALLAGHWWVREITPPPGYVLDPAPENNVQEVDVAVNQTAAVTFANRKNAADLVVLKLDSQTECPLPGAVFKLFKNDPKAEGFDPIKDFVALSVSGLDGKAWFLCLTPGDYWLVEFAAPLGYRADPANNRKVTVGPAGETVTVTCLNDPTGWLKIVKTDGHGKFLAGAEFQVSRSRDDFSNAFPLVTGPAGIAISGCLTAGTYWVKETKAPEGYRIDNPEPVEVRVKLLETAIVCFTDSREEGGLIIRKVSTVGETPLAGVTFELMDKDPADPAFGAENILYSRQTNANGEIPFPDLPAGKTYWVRETATIAGYSIDTTIVKSATIESGKTAVVVFSNAPVGYVRITKIDSIDASVKLPGAVFGIYSDAKCTTLVQTMAKTGSDGVALSAALPYGPGYPAAYYIKEITAPEGYLLNPEVFPVAFTAPGQTVPVIFADMLKSGSIVIKKVDALNPKKVLTGAEFTLYYDLGEPEPDAAAARVSNAAMLREVGKGTTGSDGILRFDNLPPGLYWLKETKAPKHYNLLKDYIPAVVIGGQTNPQAIVILNQYNPPEPIPTGMMEWTLLAVGGLALLGGGALLFLTRRRKALQPA